MTIEKTKVIDQIEVTENGCVQVRTKTSIIDNGTVLTEMFHRHVITPGQDYSNEDKRVQDICKTVHTTDVIAAYQAVVPQL